MNHYVCTGGCGGVSKNPGVCNTKSCPKHQQPLEECSCDNPDHLEKLGQKESPSEDNDN